MCIFKERYVVKGLESLSYRSSFIKLDHAMHCKSVIRNIWKMYVLIFYFHTIVLCSCAIGYYSICPHYCL